jgi:predicted helicase
MPILQLAANHRSIAAYYADLKNLSLLHATHEGAVRGAFQSLLQQCAKQFDWTVIAEYPVERPKRPSLRVDGAVVDAWKLVHGYWEAKDEHDDLRDEVKKKIAKGYPVDNILFQSPDRAILYQDGKQLLDESLTDPKKLVEVLKEFFRYEPPAYAQWELAVEEFKNRVPELAKALVERIHEERKLNSVFRDKFGGFVQTCRQAINPNLSEPAVEEMLIQHMLTERIFRKVFANPDFARRNAIASDIEGVVDALTKRSFNRDKFLSGLERFYGAIEKTAGTIESFTEKQGFLNTVYEKFFQGFSVKVADTHGIVYTPQSIVRFMVRSVDEILKKEFGRSLGSKGVHILDPFLGTGNFLLHVMRQIPKTQLAHKYKHELHGNEVMLLPYYVAAMNIEHEYSEMMGEYQPFDGLCLVDTFELAEAAQPGLFTAQNTQRVERQRQSPIFVVLGNPPYNAWQIDENDRNRNRRYDHLEKKIFETYVRSSKATLVNSLGDPYVKAIRWASDRVGEDGIVAFVTNNSYIEQLAFDGVRKELAKDFDAIYCIDLGGNVRKNPKLSGSVHNVFGIQVGVAIGVFVRRRRSQKSPAGCVISYASVDDFWRSSEKLKFLDKAGSVQGVKWTVLAPDSRGTWVTSGLEAGYDKLVAIGIKSRGDGPVVENSLFVKFSNGIQSNGDAYVFNFNRERLERSSEEMIEAYNAELDRWIRSGRVGDVEQFIRVDASKIKWVRRTRRSLARGHRADKKEIRIRRSLYRPFCIQWHFFDEAFNEELYQLPSFLPDEVSERVNRIICVSDSAFRSGFCSFALSLLPERHLCASSDAYQFFPFYTYENGKRRENVTNWALAEFRKHYADETITKWDIFHYVYGLLHHPAYRDKYKANLKRELPRIPYAPDFTAFAKAGKRLADLHVDYEKLDEYPLDRVENPEEPLNWRVEKMRLSREKDGIYYNSFLTLVGIPPEVFEYRLGNRSALEWVIDQYQVFTDKRSGITNDPNRLDDPEYIVRLIGQVITVSLETVKIVRSLPPCESGGLSAHEALTAARAGSPKEAGAAPDAIAQAGGGTPKETVAGKVAGKTKRAVSKKK